MARLPGNASAILQKMPLKVMIIVTLLCLALQENFPFSDFPMYQRMSDNDYYVFIADSEGRPIPIETLTSLRTAKLKKIYHQQLKTKLEELRAAGVAVADDASMTRDQRVEAGEYTLRWLLENCRESARPALEPLRPLRFYQVEIKFDEGRITTSPVFIASVP